MAQISLIVGTNNRPQHLRSLLYTLPLQTFQDYEVIVMDEGDNEWVQNIDDERIIYYKHEKVGDWHYTVKEKAVQHTTSNILCFPNDDAYYVPVFLEKMIHALKSCDLAYCDFLFDHNGYKQVNASPQIGSIDVGGFCIKKDVFLRYGFDKTRHADGNLVLLVSKNHTITKVGGTLYVKN